jgi:hypothetical protein
MLAAGDCLHRHQVLRRAGLHPQVGWSNTAAECSSSPPGKPGSASELRVQGSFLVSRRSRRQPPGSGASWAAQLRLHRRFVTLLARKKQPSVVAAAVAHQLAGFVRAEMTAQAA